ncbi:hypothetical protein ACFL3V_06310 [Nanoarchaeota archaeon]
MAQKISGLALLAIIAIVVGLIQEILIIMLSTEPIQVYIGSGMEIIQIILIAVLFMKLQKRTEQVQEPQEPTAPQV